MNVETAFHDLVREIRRYEKEPTHPDTEAVVEVSKEKTRSEEKTPSGIFSRRFPMLWTTNRHYLPKLGRITED